MLGVGVLRRALVACLLLASTLAAACAPRDEGPRTVVAEPAGTEAARLAAQVEDLLRGRRGTYGVVLASLGTGQRVRLADGRRFASASVYKLGVAYEVLRQVDGGSLSLDRPLVVSDQDAAEGDPAGGLAAGDQVTVRQAMQSMMAISSNAAGRALLRLVGRSRFNSTMAALGLADTRVPPDDGSFPVLRTLIGPRVATTSPGDMARLLELLARDRLLSPAGRAELRRLLALPEALDPLAASLPPGARVFAKVGNLEDASNLVGWIETPGGPLIVSVFDEGADPDEARALCAQLGQALYDQYAG